jgi:N-acetylglucosaminyl-diphospho-decaprenol L-rhamnosyltransferase
MNSADLSVIVVNYNTAGLLSRMFAALNAARGYLQIEVIVIDNASQDNSVQILKSQYPHVRLVENSSNVGFGRANNQAVSLTNGRYILLLNTDAFVSPDTLVKTVEFMDAQPQCGILGVKLVSEDGSLQPSCRYFPTPWNVFIQSTGLARFFPNSRLVDDMSWDHASTRECDWVPGCYYLIRPAVIGQVGLFDPRYFIYYEEVDHCRRAKQAGWSVVYYADTQVVHIGGESAKSEGRLTDSGRQFSPLQIESEFLYFRKFYGVTGLSAAVVLTAIADVASIAKALVKGWNAKKTVSAMQHMAVCTKVLMATRFGARATR